MRRSWRPWIPVAIVCGGIFALSSTNISAPVTSLQATLISFAVHVTEYGLLAFVAYRALARNDVDGLRGVAWAFAIALVYGITDEIHQAFVPGRSATPWDLIPDSLGAFSGGVASMRLRAHRPARAAGRP